MGVDAEHRQLVMAWPDRRLAEATGAQVPIVQAPMAGAGGVALAAAAIRGGAVGSLPCAMLSAEQVCAQAAEVRAAAPGPLNLNFFCHELDEEFDDARWRALLEPFYRAEGVAPGALPPLRRPFDAAVAEAVEAVRPEVVSFHFGLPAAELLARVRAAGAAVWGNATTVREAEWLVAQGCDAIIAQGYEAGGHAGWFLEGHRPVGLLALVRGVTEAVTVPVIAAGGIVDGRGVAAALTAGAAAVQVGTAYLAARESLIAAPFRALLGTGRAADSVFTNLFSGREARGIRNRLIEALGPVRAEAPSFPHASAALAPLRAAAEAKGRADFTPLWAGQGAARVRALPAEELTRTLAAEALAVLG